MCAILARQRPAGASYSAPRGASLTLQKYISPKPQISAQEDVLKGLESYKYISWGAGGDAGGDSASPVVPLSEEGTTQNGLETFVLKMAQAEALIVLCVPNSRRELPVYRVGGGGGAGGDVSASPVALLLLLYSHYLS